MNHGLNSSFLYSAYKIESFFINERTSKTHSISGTCFFVRGQDNELNIVTNRHCIDADFKDAKFLGYKIDKIKIIGKSTDLTKNLPDLLVEFYMIDFETIYPENRKDDVVCLRNIKIRTLNGAKVDISFFIPYELLATEKKLQDKLSVCDFVAFPGYPPWYDKLNKSPILRTGSIASDPRYNYSYTGEDEGNCIAYEAFSFGGSSGSPVFAIQKGFALGEGLKSEDDGFFREVMLIGINAGHLKDDDLARSHSGISYFYKSSVIIELLEKKN